MIKKVFFLATAMLSLYSCATKEDLAPELTQIPTAPKVLKPFEMLQDSPTCIVSKQNYITVTTPTPDDLSWYHGIDGNLNIDAPTLYSYDNYFRKGDFSGNGKIFVGFSDYYALKTGIYTTGSQRWNDSDKGINYVVIQISDFNNNRPTMQVRGGQKVLVVVNAAKTLARIKFCDLELESSYTIEASITGEITAILD